MQSFAMLLFIQDKRRRLEKEPVLEAIWYMINSRTKIDCLRK